MSNRRKPKRPVPLHPNIPITAGPDPIGEIEWTDLPFAHYPPATLEWIRAHAHEALRMNVWECEECGAKVLCYDLHPGVTPFMVAHETLGGGKCPGMCRSHFYNGESAALQRDLQGGPTHEWYRPSAAELRGLSSYSRKHVMQGGLLVRKATR